MDLSGASEQLCSISGTGLVLSAASFFLTRVMNSFMSASNKRCRTRAISKTQGSDCHFFSMKYDHMLTELPTEV